MALRIGQWRWHIVTAANLAIHFRCGATPLEKSPFFAYFLWGSKESKAPAASGVSKTIQEHTLKQNQKPENYE